MLGRGHDEAANDDRTSYSNGAPRLPHRGAGVFGLARLPRLGIDAPNNRHRATATISLAKAIDIADAVEHASKIGLPLIKFVSIHFGTAGLAETERAQDAVGKYLKLANQWLGSRGHQFAYVWVMERVTSIREHVHIMCSCPQELEREFDEKAHGVWMTKAGMLPRRKAKTGIKIERAGLRGYRRESWAWQESYKRESTDILEYSLKAIDRDNVPTNDNGDCLVTTSSGKVLVIRPEHEGTIFGRRCSRSKNISAKARRTHWAMSQPDAA